MNAFGFELFKKSINALGLISPRAAAQVSLEFFSRPGQITRPHWERVLIAKGKPRIFQNGLHAYEWGSGPTVLLIHGWQGRGTQLGMLIDPLVTMGFRVIAVDGGAHGESPGKRTNVRFFARELREIGEELGPLFAVVAHSFGAAATALALSQGLKMKCAVLVASPADLQRVIDGYKNIMGMSKKVGDAFQAALERWIRATMAETDIGVLGRKISTPALIVHDPADKEVDFKSAEIIAGNWPASELLALENVGHRKILKAPIFISAVQEYLSRFKN